MSINILSMSEQTDGQSFNRVSSISMEKALFASSSSDEKNK